MMNDAELSYWIADLLDADHEATRRYARQLRNEGLFESEGPATVNDAIMLMLAVLGCARRGDEAPRAAMTLSALPVLEMVRSADTSESPDEDERSASFSYQSPTATDCPSMDAARHRLLFGLLPHIAEAVAQNQQIGPTLPDDPMSLPIAGLPWITICRDLNFPHALITWPGHDSDESYTVFFGTKRKSPPRVRVFAEVPYGVFLALTQKFCGSPEPALEAA